MGGHPLKDEIPALVPINRDDPGVPVEERLEKMLDLAADEEWDDVRDELVDLLEDLKRARGA